MDHESADIVLDTYWQQCRGAIGRYPDGETRYVMDFDRVASRGVHMLFVRRPLRVTWWIDGEIVAEKVLSPWTGFAVHEADRVTEERP